MTGYIKYFETEEKTKTTMCWINAMKFGTRLKRY